MDDMKPVDFSMYGLIREIAVDGTHLYLYEASLLTKSEIEVLIDKYGLIGIYGSSDSLICMLKPNWYEPYEPVCIE